MTRYRLFLFTTCALLVLTACGNSLPLEKDVEQYYKNRCIETNLKFDCISKFVSFKKTNGVQQDFMGAKGYMLEGTLTYVLTDDEYTNRYIGIQGNKPAFARDVVTPKGTTKEQKVKIMFIQTEKGWRLHE